MQSKEDFFISLFQKGSQAIGDDGAVVGEWVYSQDAFFENVHFKRTWMSLEQIAYKAMLINISDAIVMNAIPKFALLTVAIPKSYSKQDLKALHKGFQKAATEYKLEVIGGDTIANNKLDISVTIISKAQKSLLRKNLKQGHLLAFTGNLGESKKGLKRLLNNGSLHHKTRFITPELKADFFYAAAPYMSTAMDISDGLFTDIEKITTASNMGIQFLQSIPKEIGSSGEEYEILFSFHPKYRLKILKLAAKFRTKVTVFAVASKRAKYRSLSKPNHF